MWCCLRPWLKHTLCREIECVEGMSDSRTLGLALDQILTVLYWVQPDCSKHRFECLSGMHYCAHAYQKHTSHLFWRLCHLSKSNGQCPRNPWNECDLSPDVCNYCKSAAHQFFIWYEQDVSHGVQATVWCVLQESLLHNNIHRCCPGEILCKSKRM